jgi:tetratricopeptide (TPR) repeat protein
MTMISCQSFLRQLDEIGHCGHSIGLIKVLTNRKDCILNQKNTPKQALSMTIAQAMDLAAKHQSIGNFQKAEGILRDILKSNPRFAPAIHLLGVIAHQVGKTAQALTIIADAIKFDPKQGLFYSNYAEMSRLLGNLDDALEYGKKAVELASNLPSAHSNLGIAYYDKGDLDNAEKCQLAALALNPKLAPALNNLGSIMRDRKDKEGAIAQYRKVLEINPQYIEAMSNLGATLTESDRYAEAIPVLLQALKMQPQYAEAHCNIASAFFGLEEYDKALVAYQNALKFKKDYPEAFIGMAKLNQEKNNLEMAEKFIRQAIAVDPENAEAYSILGGILMEGGFADKAEGAFNKALELKPQHQSALSGIGTLMMEQGRMVESEATFNKALEYEPESIVAFASLAQVRKARAGDKHIEALEALLAKTPDMPRKKAMSIHFALGKCYDDLKEADKAFAHFAIGCRLKRQTFEYSSSAHSQLIQQIKEVFNAELFKKFANAGCDSNVPIFVLGMPRSGTTLTEQIIASHPQVFGAGELPEMTRMSHQQVHGDKSIYPFNIAAYAAKDFKALGEQYIASVRQRSADAAHITDKMPANFLYLGLIHLILPNAKIVHVKRNPVDTSLSCFTKIFNRGQYFSYDLKELGEFYCDYVDLMNHWKKVLPAGTFYEVQYEELVGDNENQARQLIAYCGLEWNDACLESHKTERNIRTASVTQVRQPIYKSSVERWRIYEKDLQPLLDVLGDLVPNVSVKADEAEEKPKAKAKAKPRAEKVVAEDEPVKAVKPKAKAKAEPKPKEA